MGFGLLAGSAGWVAWAVVRSYQLEEGMVGVQFSLEHCVAFYGCDSDHMELRSQFQL